MRPFSTLLRAVEHRIVRRRFWRHVLLPRITTLSDEDFKRLFTFSEGAVSFEESFHAAARLRFFFHPRNQKDFFLHLLTQTQSEESILAEAEDVLENRFETLGSGKVSLGDAINWQKDFKSGIEWPLGPSWKLDYLNLDRPSDVKVPWELSRFHQIWWLGKAYWLTHNERYADKFRELIEDWIEKNPPGRGVNWPQAMEASIRACNWMAGYYLFCESNSLSSEFWLKFLKSLYVHGVFIRNNLEYSLRSGNHFLSNVVGMIFLGVFFRNTKAGQEWLNRGAKSFQEEMDRQVYPDGVNWEKSISYHRLVLEFFYTSAVLLSICKVKLPHSFMSRLEKMFEYTMHYTRPDGSVPNVGDGDDGRLFRFSMTDEITDHRHALSVGAILFERSDFKAAAGKFSQDALWLFGGEGFEKHQLLKPPAHALTSRAFPVGATYIMRSDRAHLFVDADDIGIRGRSGHGHNDVLSFELWAEGAPLIVDSGSYSYTSDAAARNEFRSTRAHNMVMIDGKELAEFPGIWSVKPEKTPPKVLNWKTDEHQDILEAEHYAYQSIRVVHRRRIVFEKTRIGVEVIDMFSGPGSHLLESFLHFLPDVHVEVKNATTALARKDSRQYIIKASAGEFDLRESWFSKSYGMKEKNACLRLRWKTVFPATLSLKIFHGSESEA